MRSADLTEEILFGNWMQCVRFSSVSSFLEMVSGICSMQPKPLENESKCFGAQVDRYAGQYPKEYVPKLHQCLSTSHGTAAAMQTRWILHHRRRLKTRADLANIYSQIRFGNYIFSSPIIQRTCSEGHASCADLARKDFDIAIEVDRALRSAGTH